MGALGDPWHGRPSVYNIVTVVIVIIVVITSLGKAGPTLKHTKTLKNRLA